MGALPTGTVTFLFTDIDGSTTLLQRLGDRRYAVVLEEHRLLLRAAFAEGNGQEIDTQGDAFLVAFPRARDALGTAVAAQRALTDHTFPDGASLRVRMGLHTGEPVSGTAGYVGLDVHRAARICGAAHGGQILLSDAVSALAARDLPAGVTLRDLGPHRLKDLKEPEHLLQVVHADLQADFPPLKSLDARPNNLPLQLTSFIGRDREIAEVKRLLGANRLVTLTGSGGAGKTRLALQVAADVVEDYPEGVWLAEFAPVADPTLVPETAASALNVPEQAGRDITETLIDALRSRALLLVLDNCEHLLAACRDLATALLRKCPKVRILATSREGLGVPGETLWRVPSLSVPEDLRHLPPAEELVLYDAVRLFVYRAVATSPGFTVTSKNAPAVVQVCQRLDGIPLAIELAAARVKVLAVEQIAARLDDRFRLLTGGSPTVLPRHQTLGAAIDWSYDLLSETERVMLRRLAVFAGGWTLEEAESVCAGAGVEITSILDVLTSLLDKSLVLAETQPGEARYRLLETVRQYARDRLVESGEDARVRTRHRDWFLALAEKAEPELYGQRQDPWLERLETEHDNLRAALEWSKAERDGGEAGLRLAGALFWFWHILGHWSEGRRQMEGALIRSGDAPVSSLPKVLCGAAQFAWRQGDDGRAIALSEQGLALSRKLKDNGNICWCLNSLGIVALRQGRYDQALVRFEESLVISRQIGDKESLSMALTDLAVLAIIEGDHDRAAGFCEEGLALARNIGTRGSIALALRNQGLLAMRQRNHKLATRLYAEGLVLCKGRKHWVTEECLEGLASAASGQGNFERGTRLFAAAEALRELLGRDRLPPFEAEYDQRVASARAALGDAAFAAAWADGRAMTLEQAIEYALATETG